MNRIRHLTCALALALTTTTAAALGVQGSDIPTGQLPRHVVPSLIELELTLDPAQPRFSGRTAVHADIVRATEVIWMHGRDLVIGEAAAVLPDGRRIALVAEQVHVSGVLRLAAAETLPAGPVRIELAFEAPFGNLMGAYRVKTGADDYIVTQMEPLGARSTFPSFDEPSFKQPWDITLVVPDADVAISNAPQAAVEDLAGPWKKVRFDRTDALPSYLIAFVVGPWDVPAGPDIAPRGSRTTPLPLRGIAAKGQGPRMAYSLRHTPAIVHALEDYFGLPYPYRKLDNVAAPDFGAGAMENAGLIVYRDTLMLLDEQSPVGQRQGFWGVSAHELAHQWFGNRVTMAWWDDLWLNEAFATWMGNKITGQLQPQFHTDRNLLEGGLGAMAADSLASSRRVRQPIADFTDIASAFDGITYRKGGAVLSMFENFVGEENFRDGVRDYLKAHEGGNATSTDLIEAIAARSDGRHASGADIEASFVSFIDQPGVPMVKVDLECADGGPPALLLQQQRYLPLGATSTAKQTWGLPMCVRYADGANVREECALVNGQQARFELKQATSCPAWVMPNAHGAGYYRFALAPPLQQALSAAFAQLDEREQRVHADSVMAAYGAGDLDVAPMIAALPQFAMAGSRQTATAGMDTVEWIDEHLLGTEDQRARLRAVFAAIYRPRLDALGLQPIDGESDDDRLLRSTLVGYFADSLRDPAIRAAFGRRGRNVLGLGGSKRLDPEAETRDLRGIAIAVAVEEGGREAFDLAEAHLRATSDALIRRELLAALAGATGPALAARARALVLEPGLLRLNEIHSIVHGQADTPQLRPALREWLNRSYPMLQAKLAPGGAELASAYATGMCSTADARQLQTLFEDRLQTVEGGPLELRQAVERIGLCAAARQARSGQPIGSGVD